MAGNKRVPAWTLAVAFAAGIAAYHFRDWWRVPVCAALIALSAYFIFWRK